MQKERKCRKKFCFCDIITENAGNENVSTAHNRKNQATKPRVQFVIFKRLRYFFEEAIGFDVKALLGSPPVLRLIR